MFGGEGLRITPLRLGLSGEYRGMDEPLRFALGVHGPMRLRAGTWTLVPAALALSGEGLVPTAHAHGRVALGRALLLQLEGTMPEWPTAWPALPPPLGASTAAVDFDLDYLGARDLSDPLALRARRDETRAAAEARLFELLAWIDAPTGGSPLPPLRASASAPRIEIAGAVLEGVEISLEDGDAE